MKPIRELVDSKKFDPKAYMERARKGTLESTRKSDLSRRGIIIPNATQVPNEVLDIWISALSEAELKVLLYLIRKTFGYSKENTGDRIPLSQIIKGTRKRERNIETGEVTEKIVDRGTGLSKRAALNAVMGLERAGLIEVTRGTAEDGTRDINHYRVVVREEY